MGVNLVPFDTIRRALHPGAGDQLRIAVLNLFVLFPAGLYLPFLFVRLRSWPALAALAVAGGASIELGQLATSLVVGHLARSIDVDDVILNTAGLAVGLVLARRLVAA